MATRDEFEFSDRLHEYLSEQLLKGRLALVLGAGISMPFGLPGWNQLLARLYESKGETIPVGYDATQMASHYLRTWYADDYTGFLESVRCALYAGVTVNFQDLRQNNTLAAIGSLVMASQRGSASKVITFNFDDLLERYLTYHGFVVLSAGNERHWLGSADVTILHPHGLLPFEGPIHSKEIIFDRVSYSKAIDPTRAWRQEILSLMRTHTCVFIGLSGNDDNLHSMLVNTQQQHASREENSQFWGVKFDTSDDKILAGSWEEVGVFHRQISDYDHEFPDILFRICQNAAAMRKTH